MADRPTYTEDQVRRYLDYIGKQERISRDAINSEHGLKYLNELIALQLNKVPFENLDLHYSPHHTISLDTEYLFNKMVDRRSGRGGYCMENNRFFGTILTALGYPVMPCGARVASSAEGVHDPAKCSYSGWQHSINIVYVDNKKYIVDVGFGNQGPTRAIPLVDGWTGRKTWRDWDDQRVTRDHIIDTTFKNDEQKMWIWHVRFSPDGPWAPMYCFSEVEFLPHDFHIMNYYVSRSLNVWFTHKVIVRRYLLDDQGNDIGDVILFENRVKERKYGKSEIVAQLKSEDDRVEALRKYFDIKLSPDEINGMKGWVSMINPAFKRD